MDDNVTMPYSTFPLRLCLSNFRVQHHCLEHPLRQGTDSYFRFLIQWVCGGARVFDFSKCLGDIRLAITSGQVLFLSNHQSPVTQSPLGLCVAVYEVISFQTLRCYVETVSSLLPTLPRPSLFFI